MANNVSQAEVLVLDTAADNIVAAGTSVYVRKARLAGGTTASKATICEAGGSVAKISLAHVSDSSDEVYFNGKGLKLNGLKLIAISGTGSVLYLYSDAR